MDEITREEPRYTGLESWLRSPQRCALFLLGCVLLLSAAATFQYYDAFGDWHPPIASLFKRQLLYWLIWAVVGVPVFLQAMDFFEVTAAPELLPFARFAVAMLVSSFAFAFALLFIRIKK